MRNYKNIQQGQPNKNTNLGPVPETNEYDVFEVIIKSFSSLTNQILSKNYSQK